MKYSAYPAYKNSGVEWLGEIPAHWEVKRLKFIAYIQSGVAKGRDLGGRNIVELPYLRVANVQDGYLDLSDIAKITVGKDEVERYLLRAGDVLMNEGGDYDKLGRGAVWQGQIEPCIHQNHVYAVRPHKGIDPYWINTVTLTSYAKHYFILKSKQSTNLASISSSNLKELPVVIPPVSECKAIASFLDRETAKIDALIAKKKRLIELLQEKRTAIISHAVTKGLYPTMPLEDSRIEWLGKIPAHWQVKRIRAITELIQTGPFGSQLHSEEYVSGGIPVINPSHLKDGRIEPDWNCAVDKPTWQRLSRHELREGDIIFARRGEMGRCALVTAAEAGWLCGTGSLRMRLKRDVAYPQFLNWILSTSGVRDWLLLESVGATMDNLNTTILARVPLSVPPFDEQVAIASYLDRETAKI